MSRNPIRNTTKDVCEGPFGLLILAEAMGGKGTSEIIEDMEKRGQQQVAAAAGTKLPTEGSDNPAWAKMGVVFGEPVEGDPLFRDATLPEGWSVKPTDHSMWLDLVDEKGRKRGAMFYKAAFYDRGAHINPCRRFTVQTQYAEDGEQAHLGDYVGDTLKGETYPYREETSVFYAPTVEGDAWGDESRKACVAWLNEHYPNWEDASAYWDD